MTISGVSVQYVCMRFGSHVFERERERERERELRTQRESETGKQRGRKGEMRRHNCVHI